MYAAHFAASLGLSSFVPRVPVAALRVAGLAPDFEFGALAASGVERIEAAEGARFADWHIVTPYSHGVLAIALAVAAIALGLWLRPRTEVAGTVLSSLGAAVVLHLAGDWLVDPGGLTLFVGSTRTSGLELWRVAPTIAMSLEVLVVVLRMVLFLRAVREAPVLIRLSLFALIALTAWTSTHGQRDATMPPTTVDMSAFVLWPLVRDLFLFALLATFAQRSVTNVQTARSR